MQANSAALTEVKTIEGFAVPIGQRDTETRLQEFFRGTFHGNPPDYALGQAWSQRTLQRTRLFAPKPIPSLVTDADLARSAARLADKLPFSSLPVCNPDQAHTLLLADALASAFAEVTVRRILVALGPVVLGLAALIGWKYLSVPSAGARFIRLHGITPQSLIVVDTYTQRAFFFGLSADGRQALYRLDLATSRVNHTTLTFSKDAAHSSSYQPYDELFSMAVDQRTRRLFVAWCTYYPTRGAAVGHISTVDALTGQVLRTVPAPDQDAVSLAVDSDAGLVFIDGGTALLDALTGKPLPLPAGTVAAVAVHRAGHLVLAGQSPYSGTSALYVMDSTMTRIILTIPYTGQPTGGGATGWTAPIADQATGHVFSEAIDGGLSGSVPTVRGTIVMLDGATARVLHRTTSVLNWSGASTWAGPPLVDEQAGRFYILDRDHGLLGIYDTRSGAAVRIVTIGPGNRLLSTGGIHLFFGPEDLHLDATHGRVWLVNSLDSRIRLLDGRSGKLLLTLATTDQYPPWQPGALVIDKRNNRAMIVLPPLHPAVWQGRLYYGDAINQILSMQPLVFDGVTHVDMRDATTGRHLGMAQAGVGPCSMAVDEPEHQVLAACEGGKEYIRPGWAWPNWARHLLPFLPASGPTQIRDAPGSIAVIDEDRL